MVSNTKIVVEAINKGVYTPQQVPNPFFICTFHAYRDTPGLTTGALIYLLDLFCSSPAAPVREAVAALFGKMMADKLNGPRVCSPPFLAL